MKLSLFVVIFKSVSLESSVLISLGSNVLFALTSINFNEEISFSILLK